MSDSSSHNDFAVPLPLLITGIAGVAGYNALAYFQERYPGQVIGIRQEDNWPLTRLGIEACNAEDRDALLRLFDKYQFRSVLNCAGNCALKACELDSRLAWRTNVEGMITLLSICCEREVRLVHTSIDLVFAGRDHMSPSWLGYSESDRTDPVTVYGTTMVAAEQLLLDSMPSACTLRISLPMGISFNGHAGAIDWIQSRFAKNRPATLYFDEVRTPTYTDCLNEVYGTLLANDVAGLYHAGGPRRLSLYQIAQVINRVGGYDPALLQGCPRREAGPIPPRAGNVTMDSTQLAKTIGYQPFDPWPLDEEMVPTHDEWHYERNGLRGSPDLLAEVLYRNPRRASGAA
ncbi:SDR family oxidoreductase [Bythopirellula polymerisocia]|uniref:dTDP-4-dehydrorhamnose reductase n=1 Tax=Bythopirellula polymerisocia TaxID=2528003 RepID=A0A5C6D3F8_9BACT|nr:sugar nucleotide-binding protein [Bythopirellula polymerisocia]TWU29399.1 dTDP-4-dehydrorhamnose reductase [Bythopirellula polymerisocia]